MSDKHDKKFWLLVLKLVIGAVALITLVGVSLYYSAKYYSFAPPTAPPSTDWGIAKDSPIRNQR